MEIRFQNSPKETSLMPTSEIRKNFLCESLMVDDQITMVYSHYDRAIIGGAKPVNEKLQLETQEELKSDFFLQRREIGVINVGGAGKVTAGNEVFDLEKLSCIYIGKNVESVSFESVTTADPAHYFFLSVPANVPCP